MLVLLVVALLGGVCGAVDLTVTDRATGSAVVNAVVDIITQSCVFDNDRLTLRRIAYAETRDGAAGFTFTRGGIWQVCLSSKICLDMIANSFLGERYYITFGLWHEPSVCGLWSVCRDKRWRCQFHLYSRRYLAGLSTKICLLILYNSEAIIGPHRII